MIDAGADHGAFIDEIGEHPDLVHRAAPFTLKASGREAGLLPGTLDQRVTQRFDFEGNLLQKGTSQIGIEQQRVLGGAPGKGKGPIGLGLGGLDEGRLEAPTIRRIDGVDQSRSFSHPLITDQVLSVKCHDQSPIYDFRFTAWECDTDSQGLARTNTDLPTNP